MRFLAFILVALPLLVFGQDVIIKRNGQEIKSRVVKIDKKTVSYKDVSDPEFNTIVVDKKELKMIRLESGSVIDFDKTYPRPYVGISAGFFTPLGHFSSSDPEAEFTPGFAKRGGNFNLRAGFYLGKRIGIPIEMHFNSAKFDSDTYAEQLSAGSVTTSVSAKSEDYKFTSLRSGLMYSGMLGQKLGYDFKILVGPVVLSQRELNETYTTQTISSTKTSVFKTSSGFGGGGGINLRYSITPNIGVGINWEFIASTLQITFDRDTPELGVTVRESGLQMKRELAGASTGISLYWQFKRRKEI